MAKFLQDASEAMSADGALTRPVKSFSELYKRARITGEHVSFSELETICHSLKDSLTIENLDRTQLVSLCKYMNIKAFGTDSFLRYQVRKALQQIYQDDALISAEGISSLNNEELEQACRIRGILLHDNNPISLKRELEAWLDLHLKKGIPSIILILSRAMSPQMSYVKPIDAIKETILSLPETVVNEAELHQSEVSGSNAISFEQKLQVLEKQQDLIEEELAQLSDAKASCNDIDKGDIKKISDAVSVLSSDNPVELETKMLEKLESNISEYKQDAEGLKELSDMNLREPKAAGLINARLEKIISDIKDELQLLQDKLGTRLNLLSPDDQGAISVNQLKTVFQLVKKRPSEFARLEDIIKKFDSDGDGKVMLDDILKLAKEAEEEEGLGVLVEAKTSEK
mgnify:CR=1 FL=1